MQAEQPQAEQLLLVDQMADVRAREPGAGRAAAALVERERVAGEAGVPEVEPARGGERRPGPPHPGRQHAVEHVHATLDHGEDPLRVADPHEVARPVGREERRRPLDRLQHRRPGLADRQAAERVTVEAERSDLGSIERPRSSRSRPPWTIPNRSWPSARGAARCRVAQAVVSRTASSCSRREMPGRRADVEAHRDVRAELRLHLGDHLRREPRLRAVVDRPEGDALLVDAGDRVAQREDLEAAGVGQDRPVPAHERVQAAELRDQVGAGAEMQVVRVAEQDLRPGRAHLVGVQALDGRLRADRHERRRRHSRPCAVCRSPARAAPSVALIRKLPGSGHWGLPKFAHLKVHSTFR